MNIFDWWNRLPEEIRVTLFIAHWAVCIFVIYMS